jgi:hypothetical protein
MELPGYFYDPDKKRYFKQQYVGQRPPKKPRLEVPDAPPSPRNAKLSRRTQRPDESQALAMATCQSYEEPPLMLGEDVNAFCWFGDSLVAGGSSGSVW